MHAAVEWCSQGPGSWRSQKLHDGFGLCPSFPQHLVRVTDEAFEEVEMFYLKAPIHQQDFFRLKQILSHEFHIAGQEGAISRAGELSLAFNQPHYKQFSFLCCSAKMSEA